MSWSRRLIAPLLSGSLVASAGPALGLDEPSSGWAFSEDGRAMATNDTFDSVPTWRTLPPDEFPTAIADLPGPEFLYRVGATAASGTRVARMLDGGTLSWLEAGRTPILATAVVDEKGVTWAKGQHIVSTPADCPDAASGSNLCRMGWGAMMLADLAAPAGTPVTWPTSEAVFGPDAIASTAVVDRDGTLFSFGGGSSVGTEIRVRDNGKVVVRGEAEVGGGLGGRLRGFAATLVEVPDIDVDLADTLGWPSLAVRAREVRDSGAVRDGVNRAVFDCPPSGRGLVVSQFHIGGVGRNVGPAVDPRLEGGVPVLVTEVHPLVCSAPVEPIIEFPDQPAAAVVCAWARPKHQTFITTVDGQTRTNNSSFLMRYIVATIGIVPGGAEPALLSVRVGDANDGRPFGVELAGTPLPSTQAGDLWVWAGESEVGIDTYGRKPFRNLDLNVGGQSFSLEDQWRDTLGDAFEVGPGQKPLTNCPDVMFTPEGAAEVYADGFEAGDVSAWSYSSPD